MKWSKLGTIGKIALKIAAPLYPGGTLIAEAVDSIHRTETVHQALPGPDKKEIVMATVADDKVDLIKQALGAFIDAYVAFKNAIVSLKAAVKAVKTAVQATKQIRGQ